MGLNLRCFGNKGGTLPVPGKVKEKIPTLQAGTHPCEVCRSMVLTELPGIQLKLLKLEDRRSGRLLGVLWSPSKAANRLGKQAAVKVDKASQTEE